ncbi:MAG: hypothetical protein CR992_00075 [Desulfobacterales bacterium]|nr:MAG: hypothetical protein CR992_00075 [Desulfobacterales bacterium]
MEPRPFRLKTLLAHKKRLENLAQARLAEAKNIRDDVRTKLEDAKQQFSYAVETNEQEKAEGVAIGRLILNEQKLASLASNIKGIEKNLTEKERCVAQEQKNLLKCSQEHQILERLKEEQNKSYQNYLNKKEAAMLDEIAIIKHAAETDDV